MQISNSKRHFRFNSLKKRPPASALSLARIIYFIPLTTTLFRQISHASHQQLSHNSSETTAATSNSANVADLAHCAAVLGQVLRAVEGTRDGGFAAGVDGSVAGTADGELSEGVEFNVDGVCGLALGDSLELAGLEV